MRNSFFVLILIAVFSCSKKANTQTSQKVYNDMLCEGQGKEGYFLCKEKPESKSGSIGTKFTILDADNKEVHSGFVDSGHVMWLDDNAIEIFQIPGMMPKGLKREDLIKVYILDKDSMVTKTEYLKLKTDM